MLGRSSSAAGGSGKDQFKAINGVRVKFHGGSFSAENMDKVEKAIRSVPRRDLRGVTQINVKNSDALSTRTIGGRKFGVVGLWEAKGSKNSVITVAGLDSNMGYNLTHEIGHNAYHNLMTSNNRLEWNFYYMNNWKKDMPTGYAKTSASEGFAESYAHVYNKGMTSTPYGMFINSWRQGKSAKYAR